MCWFIMSYMQKYYLSYFPVEETLDLGETPTKAFIFKKLTKYREE